MSFHGTTVGMYDLPCSCKVRHELRATEELRRLDFNYGKTTTYRRQNRDEEEGEASLESLMFRLFAFDDQDNPRGTSPFKAWQACPAPQQHHQGQYLRPSRSPKLVRAETREFGTEFGRSSSATEPSSETKLLRRGILTQETRAKSDTVIKTLAERQDGEWHRQKMSPHSSLKFHHFDKPTDYMKYYSDRVTSNNIRSHIQTRLQQNATQKSVMVSKKEKGHKTCSTKNKYFRFRVNTGKDNSGAGYGTLRVGECTARAKPMETIEIDCTKGKMKGGKILHQEKNREPLQRMLVGKATKIATMYDIKSVAKEKNPFSNEGSSVLSPNMFGGIAKPSSHSTSIQSKSPCKNLRVKVWGSPPAASLHYQMAKHGMANTNKAKHNQPKVYLKKNASEVPILQRKLPYKQTLGEKEFLHITTPKPLSSSHTESTVQVNGEFPSHTPITCASRSLLKSPSCVECAVIPRNAGNISNKLFLKRELEAAIPKNSHFRACITPSNYSSSSIANQLKERREPGKADEIASCVEHYPSDDHIQESRKLHSVASRPSVPQIGPFVLG